MTNLIIAYSIIAVVLSAYIVSIVLRTRVIQRALQHDK